MFSEDENVAMKKKYPTEQEPQRDIIMSESLNETAGKTTSSTTMDTAASGRISSSSSNPDSSTASTVTNIATSTQTEGAPEEESTSATMLDDPNGNNPSFSSPEDVISQGILSDPVAVDDTNAETSSNSAITIIHWSSLLQSPTTDSSFSPSLPIGKSLHGLALTATVERTKSLAKFGKRCSNLLYGGKHRGTFVFMEACISFS